MDFSPKQRLFRTCRMRNLAVISVYSCKPSTQEAEAREFWVQAKKEGTEGREKSTVLHYIVCRDFKTKHTFLFGIVKRTLVDFMICIFTFIAFFFFFLTLGRRRTFIHVFLPKNGRNAILHIKSIKILIEKIK